MSFEPNLAVWTLGRGTNGKWKLQHSTEDYDDAVAWFEKLAAAGRKVALCELGSFLHEGHQVAGQVAFWWNAPLNGYFAREPERRGVGCSEDFDIWVEYTFPEPASAAQPAPWGAPAVSSAQELGGLPTENIAEEQYAEAVCEHCGLIAPQNQMQWLTHDVESGHVSGSRSTRSRSNRQSTRFSQGRVTFSSSLGSGGSSSSSSRTYYRKETLLLCPDCYDKQKRDDHPILTFLTRLVE